MRTIYAKFRSTDKNHPVGYIGNGPYCQVLDTDLCLRWIQRGQWRGELPEYDLVARARMDMIWPLPVVWPRAY